MSSSPSQVRLLVMVLVAWCALSAAPVVANSPALPAAFFVIAVGLVAAVTLRFSTLVGLAMAVLGTALFAISMVLDPASAASRGGQGLGGTLSRLDQLLPALVAAVSLVGAAVCASLASWEIDGRPGAILDPALREAARDDQAEELDDEAAVQPASGRAPAASTAFVGEREEAPAATLEPPPAKPVPDEAQAHSEAAAAEQPIGSEEPAAAEQPPERRPAEIPPAEQPPAVVEEPAAAQEAPALHQSEGERAAAVEEMKAAEEPAPAGAEAPVREEDPAAGDKPAASVERATERKGPPVEEPSAATEAPLAGEAASTAGSQPGGGKKGEEIAAREFEEKNGRPESDQLEAARPDWARRRRPDDDVARRVPRRRKR